MTLSSSMLPLRGADTSFMVRAIYGVGQNYHAHAQEMGIDSHKETPVFFMKDIHTMVTTGTSIPYPPSTRLLHYEVEWVIAVGRHTGYRGDSLHHQGRVVAPLPMRMSKEEATASIVGFGIGIDLTRRDMQEEARKKGMPWFLAKNFPGACPCSPLIARALVEDEDACHIILECDGACVQHGYLYKRLWNSVDILCELSKHIAIPDGTLIYTGTPEGVGVVDSGRSVRLHAFCPQYDAMDLVLTVGREA
ncbi:MAG: fumarylacetoacetate hydrolase family protein [Alphaproteobacteria bacterium GM7ARS4]|nr:fumarylacetoacetate hydrolase family protein [Alphaproteobacteria bacterium GM7ARS4]